MVRTLKVEHETQGQPAPYPHCYGCGAENLIGLQLDLELDGDELRARFVPMDDHQGYPGTVHGGVISSLLYELMANVTRYLGDEGVLRRHAVEFRRPAPVAMPLLVKARVVEETPRGWLLAAEILDDSGRQLATGTGEAVRPNRHKS